MRTQHRPFIDWMKAVGITLIVWGHVAGRPINHLTPPIYPKQIGVALFLFALGWSLAQETRPRAQVVFSRVFDVYVYAVPLALAISALAPIRGTLNPSNYLPLLAGAHLLVNNLPANPTTWFVGTYVHVLLLWALLIRWPIRGWMVGAAIAADITIRAVLCALVGAYIAYMALFNWSAVFLCGLWWGQHDGPPIVSPSRVTAYSRGAMLAAFAVIWATVMPRLVTEWTFPFVTLSAGAGSLLITSAAVSGAYLGYTLLFLEVARCLPALRVVRFLARNTLVVFLAHMPVFYLLDWLMRPYRPTYAWAATIDLAVCLVGLSFLSEALNAAMRPREFRARIAARLFSGWPETRTPMARAGT